MTRILHVAPRLSDRGGAEQHLLALLEAFPGALAVGRADTPPPPGVSVELLPGLDNAGLGPAADLGPALDRLAGQTRSDVVHLHNVVEPSALAWGARVGAVLTIQDHRFFCPGRGKWTLSDRVCRAPMGAHCEACLPDPAYRRAVQGLTERRLAAAACMRLHVLSEYMRSELTFLRCQRISVIPPPIRAFPAGRTSGPACVLFVGRLVAAKGVADAVLAHRQSGTPLPLVLAGSGPLRGHLETMGLQVTGWLDRAGLASWLRRARAVLMPSRWQEPFGIAGVEALSLGIPVAAFQSGGIPEWHPGGELLIDWGDTEALSLALVAALDSKARLGDHLRPECILAEQQSWYQGADA